MAIYNEILAARFAKALAKMFSMKGENPAKQLAGEIMAVHPFFSGVENRFHEGWDRFMGSGVTSAVAAQVSDVRLRNPGNSGVIAVVEKVTFLNATAADQPFLDHAPQTADLANIVALTNSRLDFRQRPNSSLVLSQGNNVAAANAIEFGVLQNIHFDAIVDVNQEIPILPGEAVTMVTKAVNVIIAVGFIWRERNLEDSEKMG